MPISVAFCGFLPYLEDCCFRPREENSFRPCGSRGNVLTTFARHHRHPRIAFFAVAFAVLISWASVGQAAEHGCCLQRAASNCVCCQATGVESTRIAQASLRSHSEPMSASAEAGSCSCRLKEPAAPSRGSDRRVFEPRSDRGRVKLLSPLALAATVTKGTTAVPWIAPGDSATSSCLHSTRLRC